MTREERIILDPAELATGGRAELDLHSGPIQVRETGVDWGQAEVEAFMAQHDMGDSPVDFRLPNRVITIPLVLGAEGDYDAARLALQAKVARINEEGGWLKRELIGGSYGEAGAHLFCDLVKATLKYGGSTFAASNGVDPDAELVLEALPDFYGDPVEEAIFEGNGDAVGTFQVKGNLPGRVDLAAYEESANDQRGLAWGFRCRNYSAASSSRLAYNAEVLKPLDLASVTTLEGAYGGKAIAHTKLGTEWTPVLDNTMSGTYPTHVGLYDVWARVYTTSPEPPWVRLVYDVGDLIDPSANDPVRVPGAANFYLVNLGQVNLREGAIAPHRWIGVVQARGTGNNIAWFGPSETVYVDRLWYLPVEEGKGILRANSSFEVGLNILARDDFSQAGGKPLGGEIADIGGTWQKNGLSATDFQTTGETAIRRSVVTDAATLELHKPAALDVVNGLTLQKAQAVSVECEATLPFNLFTGVVARYKDNSNYLVAMWWDSWLSRSFTVFKVVEGVTSTVASRSQTFASNQPLRMLLSVSEAGVYTAVAECGGRTSYIRGSDADLAPGKALQKGTVGILDAGYLETLEYPNIRTYRKFVAWEPAEDAVLFAGREARLTSAGHYRSPDGAVFGPVSNADGDLPRIPVSGPEERPVELMIKPSRGDFAQVPDPGIDRILGQMSYRPCWSYVPEEA